MDRIPIIPAPNLLIVGASTRAAAESATRAGWRVLAADQFADDDLRDIAEVISLPRLDADSLAPVLDRPPLPFLYTGGLDNRPELIELLSGRHQLLGNSATIVQAAREVAGWSTRLQQTALPAIPVWDRPDREPPRDGAWLRKPVHGAGGRGISVWDDAVPITGDDRPTHYFQRRAAGPSLSALCLRDRQQTRLVGITRQLIGLPEVAAGPWAWCGNIGPVHCPSTTTRLIREIATCLGETCDLRGLFGLDFILMDDQPYVTEINPRYTGAAEILELAAGRSLIADHLAACQSFDVAPPLPMRNSPEIGEHRRDPILAGNSAAIFPDGQVSETLVLGKLILFAQADFECPDIQPWRRTPACLRTGPFIPRLVADVPTPGQWIRAGEPICTIFARANNPTACRPRLLQRAARVYRWLHAPH